MFVWDCKSDIQLSVMVLLSSTAFCQGLGSIHNLSTFFRLKQRTLYEKRFITRSFLTQSSLVTSGKKSGQVFFFFLFQTCELFLLTILTLISEFWKKKKHKTCPLFFFPVALIVFRSPCDPTFPVGCPGACFSFKRAHTAKVIWKAGWFYAFTYNLNATQTGIYPQNKFSSLRRQINF